MALDPTATNLRDAKRPQVAPLPGGDQIIATPDAVRHLQIPDEVALRPENVIPFLAGQHAKLVDITARPEIKATEGDIPEYLHDEKTPVVTAMSREEQSNLGEWRQEAFLKIQSGGSGLDDLENEIKGYINDVAKNHPELFQSDSGGTTSDVLDQWMTGQMVQETEEAKKKYQAALAMARSPEDVLLVMTSKHAQDSMTKIGRMLKVYKQQMDSLDKMQANLDLNMSKGNVSQATMMKTNIEFSRTQGDVMNLFQVIQKAMGDYERSMNSSGSIIKNIKEIATTIQNNYKS